MRARSWPLATGDRCCQSGRPCLWCWRSPTRRAAWPRPPPSTRSATALVAERAAGCCWSTSTRRRSLTWAIGIDPETLELSLHDVLLRRAKAVRRAREGRRPPRAPVHHRPGRRRGAPAHQDRPRVRAAPGARAADRRLRLRAHRLPAVARHPHDQRAHRRRRGADPAAVRDARASAASASCSRRSTTCGPTPTPTCEVHGRGRHHVRRPHQPGPPGGRGGARRSTASRCSSRRSRSRCGWPRRRPRDRSVLDHAPPLEERRGLPGARPRSSTSAAKKDDREMRSLDPQGKRALFETPPSAAPDHAAARPAAHRPRRPLLHRRAHAPAPPSSSARAAASAPAPRCPTSACASSPSRRSCPGGKHPHWMRCPACGHRRWCRIGWNE